MKTLIALCAVLLVPAQAEAADFPIKDPPWEGECERFEWADLSYNRIQQLKAAGLCDAGSHNPDGEEPPKEHRGDGVREDFDVDAPGPCCGGGGVGGTNGKDRR